MASLGLLCLNVLYLLGLSVAVGTVPGAVDTATAPGPLWGCLSRDSSDYGDLGVAPNVSTATALGRDARLSILGVLFVPYTFSCF